MLKETEEQDLFTFLQFRYIIIWNIKNSFALSCSALHFKFIIFISSIVFFHVEPCNFASNIAYYHMARGVCNHRQVISRYYNKGQVIMNNNNSRQVIPISRYYKKGQVIQDNSNSRKFITDNNMQVFPRHHNNVQVILDKNNSRQFITDNNMQVFSIYFTIMERSCTDESDYS